MAFILRWYSPKLVGGEKLGQSKRLLSTAWSHRGKVRLAQIPLYFQTICMCKSTTLIWFHSNCGHFGRGWKQCYSREMSDGHGSSAGLFHSVLPKSRVSTKG